MQILFVIVLFLCLECNPMYAKTPCCSPDLWMGHLMEKVGEFNSNMNTVSQADISTYIYYDFTTKQLRTIHNFKNLTTGKESSLTRIVNYNKGMEWKIIGEECTRAQITEKMTPPCFLDGATSFGNHSIPGSPVDVYYKQYSNGASLRATVEHTTCLFISDTYLSAGPDYRLSFGMYENITGGALPPDTFDVPPSCPKSGFVPIKKTCKQNILPWRYHNC